MFRSIAKSSRQRFLCAAMVGLGASHAWAAGILYSPVVTEVGDGTASTVGPQLGLSTAIQVYRPTIANQSSPVAQQAFASNTFVSIAYGEFSGQLTNNPGLADAAAQGLAYTGPNYVYTAGYAAADNTSSVNGTAHNRVVGYANVTTSSVTGAAIGASQPGTTAFENFFFGAVGDDTATNFWGSGDGLGSANGYQYMNNGTNITPSIGSVDAQTIQIRQGQLYGSLGASGSTGIQAIGSGTPTAGNTAQTTLFQSDVNPCAFVLLDDHAISTPVGVPFNVAYLSKRPASGDGPGGIEKWVYSASTTGNNGWSLAYTFGTPESGGTIEGYTDLAAQLVGNSVVLYATGDVTAGTGSATGSENNLEQFTDPLENGSVAGTDATEVVLATAPAMHVFRGVALTDAVPEPASLAAGLLAFGVVLGRRVPRRLE